MIKYTNVSKSYSGKVILENINLDFAQEKCHVLIGSSGSGKTTLLKLLAGLILPDSGAINSFEYSHQEFHTSSYRDSFGYVIQEGGLFPHMNAKENILLSLINQNLHARDIDEELSKLCEMVHLERELLNKLPKELSGGQRQRVGLMRALIKKPKLLLMDEPLGALDPLVRSELQKELKEIFEKLKMTVFIVTHDINEAAFFGDTITLIKEGRIIQHGGFKDLVKSPKEDFVTDFIHAQTSENVIRELNS